MFIWSRPLPASWLRSCDPAAQTFKLSQEMKCYKTRHKPNLLTLKSDLITQPCRRRPPKKKHLFDWPHLFDSISFISALCCDWSIFRSSKLGLVSVADLYSDWLFVVCLGSVLTFNLCRSVRLFFEVGERKPDHSIYLTKGWHKWSFF